MKSIRERQHRMAELIKPHPGKWVTLSADKTKVLGVSSKVESALDQAARKGESHPHLVKAPDAATAAYIF